jgi:transketolase
MRDSFIRALTELAQVDPSIVLVNGDLGFGVLTDFIKNYPDQYINAGVAEQNMTAVACGMALEGARAYTYSIANFTILRCLEQLRNDVCYHDANVTAVSVGGGFSYGQLGMSHFATEDLAILRALPNMKVVVPSDPWQAYELTKQLYTTGGPTYLRLDKDKAGLDQSGEPVILGKVRQVRSGVDAVIFATGGIVGQAMIAAEALHKEGLSVSVIDVHTVSSLRLRSIISLAGLVRLLPRHVWKGARASPDSNGSGLQISIQVSLAISSICGRPIIWIMWLLLMPCVRLPAEWCDNDQQAFVRHIVFARSFDRNCPNHAERYRASVAL